MQRNSLYTSFPSFGALLLLMLVIGCTEPAVSPDSNEPVNYSPEVGTLYTFDTYKLTPAGEQIPGIREIGRIRVIASNENFQGKSDVVVYLQEKDYQVSFYQADSSGDRSFFSTDFGLPYGPVVQPQWLRYPFKTKGKMSETLFDSTYQYSSGRTKQFLVTRTVEYLADEEKNISGQMIMTSRFLEQVTMLLVEDGKPTFTQVREKTLWYSADVGYFVQTDSFFKAGNPVTPILVESTRNVLVRYNEPRQFN